MDNPSPNQDPKPADTIVVKKSGMYLVAGFVVVIIATIIMYFVRTGNAETALEKKPEPVLHRDEPIPPQILQSDYKEKVKEMLDSGKTVNEVSKDTRIRKDEVRKIKKEHKKEKTQP